MPLSPKICCAVYLEPFRLLHLAPWQLKLLVFHVPHKAAPACNPMKIEKHIFFQRKLPLRVHLHLPAGSIFTFITTKVHLSPKDH